MTRTNKPDTPQDLPTPPEDNTRATDAKDTAPPEPVAPAPLPDASSLYEPYPGAAFFHGGRNSPIVQAMAHRLQQEGHWATAQAVGPDWTNAHKRAFAAYQHTLRPKEGGDVSGIPDKVAWDQLQVPRVSPRPRRTA
ncbi:peptidoglycan-binding protein [Streptomyces sp. NBC_01422]|uniref:peptidoglycan-binding protein n=1 Tax=Streptomyces sp. NBC_01422 TaxID=2903859 RepID=UPI002E2A2EAF|nr:peptidoglycan-binding protein [Streptomyces sp. NBC_01422]